MVFSDFTYSPVEGNSSSYQNFQPHKKLPTLEEYYKKGIEKHFPQKKDLFNFLERIVAKGENNKSYGKIKHKEVFINQSLDYLKTGSGKTGEPVIKKDGYSSEQFKDLRKNLTNGELKRLSAVRDQEKRFKSFFDKNPDFKKFLGASSGQLLSTYHLSGIMPTYAGEVGSDPARAAIAKKAAELVLKKRGMDDDTIQNSFKAPPSLLTQGSKTPTNLSNLRPKNNLTPLASAIGSPSALAVKTGVSAPIQSNHVPTSAINPPSPSKSSYNSSSLLNKKIRRAVKRQATLQNSISSHTAPAITNSKFGAFGTNAQAFGSNLGAYSTYTPLVAPVGNALNGSTGTAPLPLLQRHNNSATNLLNSRSQALGSNIYGFSTSTGGTLISGKIPSAGNLIATSLTPAVIGKRIGDYINSRALPQTPEQIRESVLRKQARFINRQLHGSNPLGLDTSIVGDIKHASTLSSVADIMRTDPNWGKTLDEQSFKRMETSSKLSSKYKSAIPSLLDPIKDTDGNITAKATLSSSGFRYMNESVAARAVKGAYTQRQRDLGEAGVSDLRKFALNSGFVPTMGELDKVGKVKQIGYALQTSLVNATPIGMLMSAAGREVLASNAGILTASTKAQIHHMGGVGKFVTIAGTAAQGLGLAWVTATSEDPITEGVATYLSSTVLQGGWQAGKAWGSVLATKKAPKFVKHGLRVGLGATAVVPAALTYGAVKLAGDLFKADSTAVDFVRKLGSQEARHQIQETRATATMRQAALQKLSSSSLNNRGQLLGNEALALKGQLY